MIVAKERLARYHLAYLKSLKILRSGQYDNEVLNDRYHRVLLSRIGKADGMDYDNQVTIEAIAGPNVRTVAEYPADEGPGYCVPANCGLASTSKAVAAKLTSLLDALCSINTNRLSSVAIVDDCEDLEMKIRCKLLAQGWRIRATDKGWKVLPPNGKRNDNA